MYLVIKAISYIGFDLTIALVLQVIIGLGTYLVVASITKDNSFACIKRAIISYYYKLYNE